jgi:phosphoribosyl-AMP cyclohydrolase / phosphoribosyl-ATP pyrophosphohydrolase
VTLGGIHDRHDWTPSTRATIHGASRVTGGGCGWGRNRRHFLWCACYVGAMDRPALKFDAQGLVTVVAVDRCTGEVRMVAHATREALERTAAERVAWFFSRSRQRLWKKGEESGHVLAVHQVLIDCDGDAVVYLVDPAGPTCHTGAETCFFRTLDGEATRPLPTLFALETTLAERAASTAGKSYTRSLLDGGAEKIGAKIREEAGELASAIASESDERVTSEAADVIYHAMVGLLSRGIPLRSVAAELARRSGTSGHAEKAAR